MQHLILVLMMKFAVDDFKKLDMRLVADPIVQEAYESGEITLKEAQVFFKAATGLEIEVVKDE